MLKNYNTDLGQNIHVTRKVGSYNSFSRFRKDQVLALNEVG
jgi:hypothetical protein